MGGIEIGKERVRINGINLNYFLDEQKFKNLNKEILESAQKNFLPVAIILAEKPIKKENQPLSPPTILTISHTNPAEIESKVIHIDCTDSGVLERVIKIIEKELKKDD